MWGTKRAEEKAEPEYPSWIQVSHELGSDYRVIWWQVVKSKAEADLVRSVAQRMRERIEALREAKAND